MPTASESVGAPSSRSGQAVTPNWVRLLVATSIAGIAWLYLVSRLVWWAWGELPLRLAG